jgi:Pyruvate kinase, barrel domain
MVAAFQIQAPRFSTVSVPSRLSLHATTTKEGTVVANGRKIMTAKETTVAAVPMVAQRWRKSTKQVATLGPASSSKEMIEKLFLAGVDVFRLNFSHGSQEQKRDLLLIIREIEEKYSHPIGILGDLQGPKLRVRIAA